MRWDNTGPSSKTCNPLCEEPVLRDSRWVVRADRCDSFYREESRDVRVVCVDGSTDLCHIVHNPEHNRIRDSQKCFQTEIEGELLERWCRIREMCDQKCVFAKIMWSVVSATGNQWKKYYVTWIWNTNKLNSSNYRFKQTHSNCIYYFQNSKPHRIKYQLWYHRKF